MLTARFSTRNSTLSLHDALPICGIYFHFPNKQAIFLALLDQMASLLRSRAENAMAAEPDIRKRGDVALATMLHTFAGHQDRKSTRLNSSHVSISYAVFCLKKKRT